jgi:hypothetical protein
MVLLYHIFIKAIKLRNTHEVQIGNHFFRTLLVLQKSLNGSPIKRYNPAGFTAFKRSIIRQKADLAGTIASKTRITGNLTANRRFVPAQIGSNLGLGVTLFQQGRNLVSFFSAEMVVGHCASSTVRSREPRA